MWRQVPHPGQLRKRVHGVRVALDDLAVEQTHDVVGEAGVAWVMRHHAQRGPALVKVRDQLHDLLAVLRIEVSRGFVGEQDLWIANHRARNRDALLLATRELDRACACSGAPSERGRERR